MSTENQLTAIPSQELAAPAQLSVLEIIGAAVRGGITSENVAVVKELMAMRREEETHQAQKDFNSAFVKLQSEIPVIVASSIIPNRGKYERFEDVMRQIAEPLRRNGFSLAFEQRADEKRITVTCHLRHIAGHAASTPFSVRLGGRADSETQADCKASTTAKRNALLQALNIIIRQDFYQSDEADSAMEGSFITASQAADLRALCEETEADVAKFLAFAGAKTFEEIMSSRLEDLTQKLEARRK